MGRKKKWAHKAPTFANFVLLFDLCSDELQKEYLEILRKQPRPGTLCGEIVPRDFNALSYGQLDDLRELTKDNGITVVYDLCEIIFGKPLLLINEDINTVFGFINFCVSEINRINKIFASIKTEYTSEEKAAGIEGLDFGSFGVLDWYAKRMGIADHNKVRDIAWVRIFTCMRNDHEQQMFERRLQDAYMHSARVSQSHKR